MTNRETFLSNAREVRNMKLAASDAEMMKLLDAASSWSDFSTIRADWRAYRQALRDHPEAFPDPCTEADIPPMPLSPTEQAALSAKENEPSN